MIALEYRTVDKSEWDRGPWDSEPDKVQWKDEATGLPCLIVRSSLGALCGYVGVADGHPSFGKDYNEFDADVHGGLTYADLCRPHGDDESSGICHIAAPGEPDHVWWFGFDCAHGGDYSPAQSRFKDDCFRRSWHEEYREVPYVRGEVKALARQLAKVSSKEERA